MAETSPETKKRPRHPRGREKWLLHKMWRFISVRGWNPSGPELLTFCRHRGSRKTIHRVLVDLRKQGMVANESRRWKVTEEGRSLLGLPIVNARRNPPQKATARSRKRTGLRRYLDIVKALDSDNLDVAD